MTFSQFSFFVYRHYIQTYLIDFFLGLHERLFLTNADALPESDLNQDCDHILVA